MSRLTKTKTTGVMLAVMLLAGCQGDAGGDPVELAKGALAKGDTQAAVVHLKAALQKTPESAESRFLLGRALQDQGNAYAAIVEYRKAEELGFNASELAPRHARALLFLGQYKTTVDKFAKADIQGADAQADLSTTVGLAYAGLGDAESAMRFVDRALNVAPKNGWAMRAKANLLAGQGKIDDALKLVEQSLEPDRPNGDAWLLRGEILRRAKRDAQGALAAFAMAAKDPQTVLAAQFSMTETHLLAGSLKDAAKHLKEIKRMSPKAPRTAFLEATLAYESGEYQKAREIAQRFATRSASNGAFHVLAGSAALKTGELVQAESLLGRAVSQAPRSTLARWRLAETYIQMGQTAKARTTLAPLVEVERPNATSLALLATTHLQDGQFDKATALYQRAVAIQPKDVKIRTSLAALGLASGRSDQALGELEAIAAADSGTTADMTLINAHLARREFDAALRAIERLQGKQAKSAVPVHLRGLVLLRKGDRDGARKAFDAAVKADPKFFAAVAQLVELDAQDGKVDDGQSRLEAAIKADPASITPRMSLLAFKARTGRPPAELKAVAEDAIRVAPTEPAPRLALISLYQEIKDLKGALTVAQAALTAMPDRPQILDAVGAVQLAAGEPQQAISTFSKLASVQPNSPLAHLRLADLYMSKGDRRAAMSSLSRAVELAPESPDVLRRVVLQITRTRETKEGLQIAKDIQKRLPARAAGYLLEGDVYTVAKDFRNAELAYQKALDKEAIPERAPISIYLSRVSMGQEAEAARFVEGWLKSHTKDLATRVRLGEVALRQAQYDKAEVYLRQAVDIAPDNATSLRLLATAQLAKGSRDALTHARRAVELAPGDASAQGLLAQALMSGGEIDQAIAHARRAVSLSGGQPAFRLDMAKLLVKAGKKDEARAELSVLAALGAAFPRAAEVEALQKAL